MTEPGIAVKAGVVRIPLGTVTLRNMQVAQESTTTHIGFEANRIQWVALPMAVSNTVLSKIRFEYRPT